MYDLGAFPKMDDLHLLSGKLHCDDFWPSRINVLDAIYGTIDCGNEQDWTNIPSGDLT
jgi:hypothetical protein